MRYLLLLVTMLFTVGLTAQNSEKEEGQRMGEKLEQQRIAYITTELDLTVKEAQAFWPIYNSHQKQLDEFRRDRWEDTDIDQMTDNEAENILKQTIIAQSRKSELQLKFINDLEEVLSAKKRLKLMRVERNFKKKVLKRYQKRMMRDEKRMNRDEKRKEKEVKKQERKEKRGM